jgi:hypothetical protein
MKLRVCHNLQCVESGWDKEIRLSVLLNAAKMKETSTTHFNIIPLSLPTAVFPRGFSTKMLYV